MLAKSALRGLYCRSLALRSHRKTGMTYNLEHICVVLSSLSASVGTPIQWMGGCNKLSLLVIKKVCSLPAYSGKIFINAEDSLAVCPIRH